MANERPDPPRGVLHDARPDRHVRYLPTGEDLAAFVEHYWIVEWDRRGLPTPRRAAVLSHPSVHLVVSGARAEVVGVVLGRFERELEETGRAFGIKLHPGAFYPFVREPVSTYTNREVSLATIFGDAGARYASAVAAEPDDQRCVELAERFLRAHLPPPDESMARARAIVEYAAGERTVLRVDQLVEAFAIDKRAMQRLFERYVGASPKWVIQRYRMHEALARIDRGDTVDWAAFALELGYFDQAHFSNDFKAMVGCAPSAYLARSYSSS
jgi:AraC-like DNA-binding protein